MMAYHSLYDQYESYQMCITPTQPHNVINTSLTQLPLAHTTTVTVTLSSTDTQQRAEANHVVPAT